MKTTILNALSLAAILATIGYAATANASPVTFAEDTIRATATDDNAVSGPVAVCGEGDPLCDDSFVCRDDGAGRTCETVEGWVARTYAAAHFQTVGPKGWR